MSDASIGYGTLFYMADSLFAEVVKITPPALSRDAVDASHEQAPGEYRRYVPGMNGAGEISLELNFIPASDDTARIIAALSQDDAIAVRIVFPDSLNTTWSMDAIVTNFEIDVPSDDKMTASVTLQVTDEPSFG